MPRQRIIHIWAMATYFPGISGGDKIFLECARHWANAGYRVVIYTNESGSDMVKSHGISNLEVILLPCMEYHEHGYFVHYVARIVKACQHAFTLLLDCRDHHLIYSASDFWQDSLPAFIQKLRYPVSKWIAGLYFFAPSPFTSQKDIEYRGGKQPVSLKSCLYYFTQKIIYPILRWKVDGIVVANELDRQILEEDGMSRDKSFAIYGGVDLKAAQSVPAQNLVYDGCFLGRFHVQKGVLFLIPIWKEVLKSLPNAKLLIIGEGSLKSELERQIAADHLEKNVTISNYLDGAAKFSAYKSSRVFLHTPVWDTGGMAAGEAMAAGLPVVAFNNPGYKYTYPRGMLKAERESAKDFAAKVVELLKNPQLYNEVKADAEDFIKAWDWKARADAIRDKFKHLFEPSA